MVKSSFFNEMIQPMASRNTTRTPPAANRPTRRARSCWSAGSFEARIEMKITLSTPSTTSRVSRAASAVHAAGSESQDMAPR